MTATGIAPSAKDGASVTGPSNGLVRSLGTTMAETYGRMGGGGEVGVGEVRDPRRRSED